MTIGTLSELLLERASELGAAPAYRFLASGDAEGQQETRTYEQLTTRARAIGAQLQATEGTGDRALLLYAPGLDFMDGFLGAALGGMIPVPAYPPEPSRIERGLARLRAIIEDS